MMGKDYQNILIIKPSALGDIVHAMPVLGSLRKALPKARLVWLVRTEFAPLLECTDQVDEILLFDRKRLGHWYYNIHAFQDLRKFAKQLKNGRFDLVLDLQGLFRTALFGKMTGCRTRIGMANAREGGGLFYTHKIAPPASMHLLDGYHDMLNAAGITEFVTECEIAPPKEAVDSVHEKLTQAKIQDKPFLVLVPSSAHESKCWPAERFASVAEQIHDKFGFAVVTVGTVKDRPVIDAIVQRCKVPVTDLSEQTSIKELIALLGQSSAVISNDTGPGHIADALNIPTVVIFGHTNPMRVGSYNRPERVAAIDPFNRPRTIESENPAHLIKHVPIELVLEKITSQLNSHKYEPVE